MHNTTLIVLTTLALVATACTPTAEAPTAAPDVTAEPTATAEPSATLEPTLAPLTADAIIGAWKAAGLEAEDARPMTADDYGMAPYVCGDGATRFYIPALGEGNGGRLYICEDVADADKLETYYDSIGEASAMLVTHLYRAAGGKALVQINGTLADDIAAQYGAAMVAAVGE